MKSTWAPASMDADRKEEIKKAFSASTVIRRRLMEILDQKKNGSIHACQSKNLYENPNWALLQADSRGYERALKEIKNLLEEK